jgi:cytochrome c biogenesis protein CcmG/thiol:disulfide interchange protein DsbE
MRQLRGRPVVLNVWASWCGPCIVEGPTISAAAKRFGGAAYFVGVDSQDQIAPARAYIARFGWTFPSVFDPQARIMNGLGFLAQPITQIYLADGSKDPHGFWASEVPAREIMAELTRLTRPG